MYCGKGENRWVGGGGRGIEKKGKEEVEVGNVPVCSSPHCVSAVSHGGDHQGGIALHIS